eukprot:CAMPEP_0117435386 /NCGR_PEP_ID=MMETSP0759-20121206/454_1 /TAXON_ID=63605 /ORGANISM="Percolomonas cosmopolitus, Strain WS" /LENGTH=638 /DNA_ID=CAMNT_0005226931 /DNA_START=1 /DNA_END=1917 /DNA_ORIENTATION=+
MMSATDSQIYDKTTGMKFYKGKLLGKGGFAKCYEVTESGSTKLHAAKQIDKISLRKQKTKEKLSTEIKIHSSLHNEYVCKFERYFEDSNYVYILLELCKCRSMMDLLRKKKRLSENETRYLMKQLLLGIEYMHKNRVIHRDLKLGNLFLDADAYGSLVVKIGDFGLAAQLDYDGQRKRTICGTPNYIAPEILMGGSVGHSYEVDVWSFGVILYTCLIGKPPFETMHVKTTYRKIKANRYSFPMDKHISTEAKDLISSILITEATSRPTVSEILQHPFFARDPHAHENCPRSLVEYSERVTGQKFSQTAAAGAHYRRSATVDADLKRGPEDVHLARGTALADLLHANKENRYANSARSPPKAKRVDDLLKHDYFKATEQDNHRMPLGEVQNFKKAAAPATQDDAPVASKPLGGVGNEMNIMHENITRSFAGAADFKDMQSDDANLKGPSVWVSEYSDFSAKYGLAYRFNNGIVGAFYNDCTKMLWHPVTDEVIYITRGSSKSIERDVYTIDNYPESIKKKIVLIKYFKASFDKKKKFTSDMITAQRLAEAAQDIYVKMWVKTSHAYVFRLSNRVVQVAFNDASEIILSSEAKLITYTNRHGDKKTYTLSSVMSSYSDPGLAKRLKYAKDVLFSLISKRK